MEYTIESLRQAYQAGQPLKYLFFWGHKQTEGPVTKACLSQWYPSPFEAEGHRFRWAEQYMMSWKALLFDDQDSFQKIMEAKHPGECKQRGKQVRGFDNAIWDQHKRRIVTQGSYYKFSQNPELGAFLLATGDRVLVEASPYDRIWGVGLALGDEKLQNPLLWRGQNLLGFSLMEARQLLARQEQEKITKV